MKRKWIFLAPLAMLLFIAVGGAIVQLLWNSLLPALFAIGAVGGACGGPVAMTDDRQPILGALTDGDADGTIQPVLGTRAARRARAQ